MAMRAREEDFAEELSNEYRRGIVEKPFVGAQPKMLRLPEIATLDEMERATRFTCAVVEERIKAATAIQIIVDSSTKMSALVRKVLEDSIDDAQVATSAPTRVCMGNDWLHTIPQLETAIVPRCGERLLVYVGVPGKGIQISLRSQVANDFEAAEAGSRLIVLVKGVCMLPIGSQSQNIFGVNEEKVLEAIVSSVRVKGAIAWGLTTGTKKEILAMTYNEYPVDGGALPEPLSFTDSDKTPWDLLAGWCKYTNTVKLARPALPVVNYYDSGLTVNVMMMMNADRKLSLLTDVDGLMISREGSIGHMISKLNQLANVEPYNTTKGVYNFWIGDGAARLNGGLELAFHTMESYKGRSLMTLFVFNNHVWAVEDNLVQDEVEEHKLFNTDYYNILCAHPKVHLCEGEAQLRSTLAALSKKTNLFLEDKAEAEMCVVVVRGITLSVPPLIGSLDPIRQSTDMAFLRDTLGAFAEGCKHKVPMYGCSHFESIQYLHIFMEEMPEGKKYQYVCGRTDIQAAHMCGFAQPDGKCVLFINDVYGIHSLGESLRGILSGFGGKQLLLMIWHPMLLDITDHFNYHRQPMVWPSLGPQLASYYVRTAKDAFFFEFNGKPTNDVKIALAKGTPLVVVNMLPVQERDYLALDIRAHVK